MNKRLLTLLTGAVGIVALASCGPKSANIETHVYNFPGIGYQDNDYFSAKRLSYNLTVNETKQIEIESFPEQYTLNQIEFTSNDESIVSVSETGVLTGHKKGYTDILITSKDGKISRKVRAIVSASSAKADVQGVIDNIKNKYNSESYSHVRKCVRYEYSEEFYGCEGVQQYGSQSYEAIGYDMDAGYFFVEGPYITYRTEGGAPEVSDGKWIFYQINYGQYVRMIHITENEKNYFDLNTSAYETYDEAIKGILNCFFVSGEKIVNDALEDFDGKTDFSDFIGMSSTKFYSVDEESLLLSYSESGTKQVVDADDEINYFNIPTDTLYDYVYKQDFLNSKNLTRTLTADMTMSYELEGKHWTRSFNRSQIFDEEFEIVKVQNPKDNGYKLVDTMYDL